MITIDATAMHFATLGEKLRELRGQEVTIENCLGQRYIAAGLPDTKITIHGVPGNDLCCYMGAGSEVTVWGNAQDAVGDTMGGGKLTIHGNTGDAVGYAMRGGLILVEGNAGFRAGIHMKEYGTQIPQIVIGGHAEEFLGEYQAGGVLVALGLNQDITKSAPVGRFCGTGQHGGRIFLRSAVLPEELPPQVFARKVNEDDRALLLPLLQAYCDAFGADLGELTDSPYILLTPNSANPYHSLYTQY